MRFVSPLLKYVVYPTLHHTGWLGRNTPRTGCAIVNYHGVVPADYAGDDAFLDGNLVSPDVLRQQLRLLNSHYDVIQPEAFRAWIERGEALSPRAVLLTCDDGLVNTLTDMLPVLRGEGVSCLFFVTGASCRDQPSMLWYEELYHLLRTARVHRIDVQLPTNDFDLAISRGHFQTWWLEVVRQVSMLGAKKREDWMDLLRSRLGTAQSLCSGRRWRLLNVHELRQLAEAGMSIGAHTLSHPVLSQCSDGEARREIEESKIAIERALEQPVWAFAYPFGNPATMGDREIRLAREAGFACAFLNVEGGVERSDPYSLCRTHVSADMSIAEFEAHLTGFHTRLQRAVRG